MIYREILTSSCMVCHGVFQHGYAYYICLGEWSLCHIHDMLCVQVGNGSGSPYKFPNQTAEYVVKWVLGAKKYYNLDIDYVGVRLK